jgi:hypothetical protein
MERETGFEPATSSLGIWSSFEYRELMRSWRSILNIESHGVSAFYAVCPLNAVTAVMERVLPVDFRFTSLESSL